MASRYADQKATREALALADQHRSRATALERAIRKHYEQCKAGNWGYDDELWAMVGLEADPEEMG